MALGQLLIYVKFIWIFCLNY